MTKGRLATPELQLACLFALLITMARLWLAHPLRFCGTPDACFYLGLGQNLASGQGFYARFLYDFQLAHLSLPNTGIEYWRPGISLLLQVLRPFGGVTLGSSIVLTTLIGPVYAAAAWHVVRQNAGGRRLALGAFTLCLVAAPVWIGSLTPDSGLFYGTATAWFLALFTVRRQGTVQDVLALCCVAAAYFIRNDAALLLFPLGWVLWRRHRAGRALPVASHEGSSLLYAAAMFCGFALALVPMHLLYRHVLGVAFPSGTAQAFYLNDLSDFVRYGEPVSRHTLFAHGLKHLVLFRISTLITALYRIGALVIGYAALIFLPGLFWPGRAGSPLHSPPHSHSRNGIPELAGPLAFLAVVFAIYMVLLPAIGGFSILRSVMSVLPVITVLVVLGIRRMVADQRLATVLTVTLIGTYLVGGVTADRREVEAANRIGDADRAAARTLAAAGATPAAAVIMTPDPVQFSVTTGYAAIALPINGLDAVVAAAQRFHATHVILNSEDMPASPEDLKLRLQPIRSEQLPAEHLLILSLPATPVTLPKTGGGIDH